MLSDDGGVGTTSSKVRRTRLSFGDLTVAFAAVVLFRVALGAARRADDRFGRLAERATAFPFVFLDVALARLPPRRFAMAFSSFRTLTVCR
ncbi:MAG TPA: hypothetical protein VEU08_13905 [Vicinamibacterales bacterium]|nr:hypothetical protein [Vicinamibacterales bacterium]